MFEFDSQISFSGCATSTSQTSTFIAQARRDAFPSPSRFRVDAAFEPLFAMYDILRESMVGEYLNRFSGGRILPYPDERPDYVVPEQYLTTYTPPSSSAPVTRAASSATLGGKDDAYPSCEGGGCEKCDALTSDSKLEARSAEPSVSEKIALDTKGYQLVDWYDEHDPENPRNWSFRKRSLVMFEISFLTFVSFPRVPP